MKPRDRRAFILGNTAVIAPPHVPEIRLHLADDAHALWHKTEEELEAIGLPPPFWAFAWAGGQGLARYILDNPDTVAGKRVVDFATGSGLVAIAAAMAGASVVTASDIDPFCADAVALNAQLNGVEIIFTDTDLTGLDIDADTILAGDVFFDRAMAASVEEWLRQLARRGRQVLVGDPGRSYLPKAGLEKRAEYEVPVTRVLEDSEIKRTCVYRFT